MRKNKQVIFFSQIDGSHRKNNLLLRFFPQSHGKCISENLNGHQYGQKGLADVMPKKKENNLYKPAR